MRRPAIFALAIALAPASACLPTSPVPVKMTMPGVSPFPPDFLREVIVTNFRDEAPSSAFDLGRELQDYLTTELGRSFRGTVSRMAVSSDESAALDDAAFWRQAAGGRERAVVLAGSARLVGLTRKALQKAKLPLDGPFNIDRRGLVELRHFALSIDIALISAATGELLYKKKFLAEQDFIDLEKPPDIAFPELADRVRGRFFPVLLGSSTFEERTLLRR